MQENDLSATTPRRGGRRKGSGRRADASAPWSLRAIQALADGTRWSIVRYLSNHEASVGAIAREVDRSVACTSKHISILNEVEIIVTARKGRAVVCRLAEAGSLAGDLLAALDLEPIVEAPRPRDRSHAPELASR